MNYKHFGKTILRTLFPPLIAYFVILGLVDLLAVLYRLPSAFFRDFIRFSFFFLLCWFALLAYLNWHRCKQAVRQQFDQLHAATPVEDVLLHQITAEKQQFNRQLQQLTSRQQNQLDNLDLLSHEIKNSLTTLKAGAENQPAVTSATVKAAVADADYLLDLLLNDERLNMGSNDFDFRWTSLEKLVNEVIKQNADLFIHQQLTPKLAGLGVTVLTDPKWLRFCLNQLLTNAIKYSSPGQQISFTLSQNTLTVTDHGCGIPASDLPRIFENGFTGHNGHQTTKSTGMGLYLVKKVADRLGYQVQVQSAVGQGTSVSLTFPPESIR